MYHELRERKVAGLDALQQLQQEVRVMLLSGTESVGCSIRGEEGGREGGNGRRLRGRSIC